jgi:hypothetical protein
LDGRRRGEGELVGVVGWSHRGRRIWGRFDKSVLAVTYGQNVIRVTYKSIDITF